MSDFVKVLFFVNVFCAGIDLCLFILTGEIYNLVVALACMTVAFCVCRNEEQE